MKTIHKILEQHKSVIFPGIFDGVTTHLAKKCNFPLAFVTGYGSSASYLGLPDMGFLNQSDMLNIVNRCTSVAPDLPIIADADTGYGNEENVRHTIRSLIRAGAKGCFLEDQVWPKRCGHMQGKQIIPLEDFKLKLAAAVEEIGDKDFFLVSRTDALQVADEDEALVRMHAAKEVGVDGFFIEAPTDVEQMKRLCAKAPTPLVANLIEGARTPVLKKSELEEIGYALILYPLTALYAGTKGMYDALSALAENEISTHSLLSFTEFNEIIGVPDAANKTKE